MQSADVDDGAAYELQHGLPLFGRWRLPVATPAVTWQRFGVIVVLGSVARRRPRWCALHLSDFAWARVHDASVGPACGSAEGISS